MRQKAENRLQICLFYRKCSLLLPVLFIDRVYMEGEELQIPYLTEQAEIGYPIITGMLVDDAGNYWLQSPYEGVAAVIAGDTLKNHPHFPGQRP